MNPAQSHKSFCVTFQVGRELKTRIEARTETDAAAIAEYLFRTRGDHHFEHAPEMIIDSDVVDWEAR